MDLFAAAYQLYAQATQSPGSNWVDILEKGGVLAVLVLIILGGSRRLWVWGWQYREMENDRDFWRDVALKTVDITEAVAGRRK